MSATVRKTTSAGASITRVTVTLAMRRLSPPPDAAGVPTGAPGTWAAPGFPRRGSPSAPSRARWESALARTAPWHVSAAQTPSSRAVRMPPRGRWPRLPRTAGRRRPGRSSGRRCRGPRAAPPHTSRPVAASTARRRLSSVAAMNSRPPAVDDGRGAAGTARALPAVGQRLGDADRLPPRDLARRHVDRRQLAPRRLLARHPHPVEVDLEARRPDSLLVRRRRSVVLRLDHPAERPDVHREDEGVAGRGVERHAAPVGAADAAREVERRARRAAGGDGRPTA